MKLQYKLSAALAGAALITSVFAPVASASPVTISGNLSGSHNYVNVFSATNCDLDQSNESEIVTQVYTSSNSGGNKISDNHGGGSISTGSSSNTTTVGVTGSSNTATNPCCGCSAGTTAVSVTDNGKKSTNVANLVTLSNQTVSQGNSSGISTGVTTKSGSGKNSIKDNTGKGTKSITTSSSTNTTTVTVGGSSNTVN